jgi:hypothetical protein
MHQTTRDRLWFGTLALLAVLVATPGIHAFERWLSGRTAFWVSHGLAAFLLALVAWRWTVARARARTPRRGAV